MLNHDSVTVSTIGVNSNDFLVPLKKGNVVVSKKILWYTIHNKISLQDTRLVRSCKDSETLLAGLRNAGFNVVYGNSSGRSAHSAVQTVKKTKTGLEMCR